MIEAIFDWTGETSKAYLIRKVNWKVTYFFTPEVCITTMLEF